MLQKFKQSHLDLVILNPTLIVDLRTEEIMLQNYELAKERVFPLISHVKPMVLYALE